MGYAEAESTGTARFFIEQNLEATSRCSRKMQEKYVCNAGGRIRWVDILLVWMDNKTVAFASKREKRRRERCIFSPLSAVHLQIGW